MSNYKIFNVFVSSTYTDLKKLRKDIKSTIEQFGHRAEGMEIFTAGGKQWSKITQSIDKCDIFILISGGRYGTNFINVSYTESEYDYAKQKDKYIVPLIYDIKIKEDIEKVKKFREKIQRDVHFKKCKTQKDIIREVSAVLHEIGGSDIVSHKTSALEKLNNPDDWVVDGDDIYYEPNSDFAIVLDSETVPNDNWRGQFCTFQNDTLLVKEIWDRLNLKCGLNSIDFDIKIYDAKIIRQVRVLKKFRVSQFFIKHFPTLHSSGIYYLPAYEVLYNFFKGSGIIKSDSDNDSIKNAIKELPEYKLCRILHLNHKDFNTSQSNDFILDYIDICYLKKVMGELK